MNEILSQELKDPDSLLKQAILPLESLLMHKGDDTVNK
jgi:hypothetical protein